MGPRRARHSARNHLGLLHASRQHLGQAAPPRHGRREPAAPGRSLLRTRELGGVPELPRRHIYRGWYGVPGADRGLRTLLLARWRDHSRAMRDPESTQCQRRVEKARADFLRVSLAGHVTLPGEDVPDWKNCGQCTDCYLPAYQYRPGGSVQYMLAKGDFEKPDEPGTRRWDSSLRATTTRLARARATRSSRAGR